MPDINVSLITSAIAELCITANYKLRADIRRSLNAVKKKEKGLARYAIETILDNADIAEKEHVPICQDTGMAVVFLEIGQDVRIKGDLAKAVNDGVRIGYKKGYLRSSVVDDLFGLRRNTGDNTPAIIHTKITSGNKLKITVLPKGFGSENASALRMFKPSDGTEKVEDFIVETVRKYGSNACPPLIIGIGIGGTFEKCAEMAKEALLKKLSKHQSANASELEKRLLKKINSLKIGPAGFGGKTTALAVNIETYPTHIAGLPVAVNISCWALRQAEAVL
jgi:fumarate hydratase subunit alpha